MIYWKDFVIDDVIGPYLSIEGSVESEDNSCREARLVCQSVMEDAVGNTKDRKVDRKIQETGQEQRPARMVGLSSLDLQLIEPGMEASWHRATTERQGGVR